MAVEFREDSTSVPIAGGKSVHISPGQPWPSAYRGSRYSIVDHDDFENAAVKWEHRDLKIFCEPPQSLRRALVLLGKSGGYGIIRITADGEVLTKIPADDYKHVDQAPVSEGWIPVYVGKIAGSFDFDEVETDPDVPMGDIGVWPGLPFKHGERWSVTHDGELHWRWKDYDFVSAFDHPQLVEKYRSFRPKGGRLYITEQGHIWGNLGLDEVPKKKARDVQDAVSSWREDAETRGDAATLRLVNRRLTATSRDDDPASGLLPVHLGQVQSFDNGVVPQPVVEDTSYYAVVGQYENVFE